MKNELKYILVTGGAGYIGSHTVVTLIENGYTPIIIDDFRNANKDIIQRLEEITQTKIIYFPYACQEIEKLMDVFYRYSIEGIIHFAADKAVGESVANPLKYFDNNLGSLVSMLKLIKEFNIENFVFSSSCTVYGEPKEIPVTESSPTSYNSPYGYTKKVSEEIIMQFIKSYPKVKATLLRYFNPVGAHHSGLIGEEPGGIPNSLLPFITQTAAGIRKELIVFGANYDTPDGTCIRDYIHVVDLAKAHVAALKNTEYFKINPRIYNLGTGRGTSVLEMIQTFEQVNQIKIPYKIGKRREGDISQIFADTSIANRELSWKTEKSVADAVASAWKFEQFIRTKRNYEK